MNGGSESGFKTEPIKWRVLRNAEGPVRLLSDKILDTYYYHSEDGWYHDVYWQNCLMKQWLNSELEEGGFSDAAFSPKEFDAVALKEERLGRVMLLSRGETEDPEWYADRRTSLLATDSDFTAAGGTVGPRNFGKNGAWVLREVRATAVVYYVDADGQYIDIMYGDHFIFAVRPSVYINSAKVLFTSPAVGGKTAMGLTAVLGYDGDDHKLTVEEAKTGDHEYNSAMVLNGETVKYYGRLKNIGDADAESGTMTLTLPINVDAESGDRLFVFNEQCNGDGKTDYASDLCELALRAAGAVTPRLRIGTATGEWEVSYDEGDTWTSLGVKATGDKGDKGDRGEAGQNGTTPRLKIGNDNFWYVSDDGGKTWASLGAKATGKAGADSKNGTNGKDGKDGKDGQDGVGIAKAEIDESGALILTFTDGRTVDLGRVVGADGKDGLSPFIGENSDRWIGEKDTGVRAAADAAAAADPASTSAASPALIAVGAVAGPALIGDLGLLMYIVRKKKKNIV